MHSQHSSAQQVARSGVSESYPSTRNTADSLRIMNPSSYPMKPVTGVVTQPRTQTPNQQVQVTATTVSRSAREAGDIASTHSVGSLGSREKSTLRDLSDLVVSLRCPLTQAMVAELRRVSVLRAEGILAHYSSILRQDVITVQTQILRALAAKLKHYGFSSLVVPLRDHILTVHNYPSTQTIELEGSISELVNPMTAASMAERVDAQGLTAVLRDTTISLTLQHASEFLRGASTDNNMVLLVQCINRVVADSGIEEEARNTAVRNYVYNRQGAFKTTSMSSLRSSSGSVMISGSPVRQVPQSPPHHMMQQVYSSSPVYRTSSPADSQNVANASMSSISLAATSYQAYTSPAMQSTYGTAAPIAQPTYTATAPAAQTIYSTTTTAAQPTYTATTPAAQTIYSTTTPAAQPTYTATAPAAQTVYSTTTPVAQPTYTATGPVAQTTGTTTTPIAQPTYTAKPPVTQPTYTTTTPNPQPTYMTATPVVPTAHGMTAPAAQTTYTQQTPPLAMQSTHSTSTAAAVASTSATPVTQSTYSTTSPPTYTSVQPATAYVSSSEVTQQHYSSATQISQEFATLPPLAPSTSPVIVSRNIAPESQKADGGSSHSVSTPQHTPSPLAAYAQSSPALAKTVSPIGVTTATAPSSQAVLYIPESTEGHTVDYKHVKSYPTTVTVPVSTSKVTEEILGQQSTAHSRNPSATPSASHSEHSSHSAVLSSTQGVTPTNTEMTPTNVVITDMPPAMYQQTTVVAAEPPSTPSVIERTVETAAPTTYPEDTAAYQPETTTYQQVELTTVETETVETNVGTVVDSAPTVTALHDIKSTDETGYQPLSTPTSVDVSSAQRHVTEKLSSSTQHVVTEPISSVVLRHRDNTPLMTPSPVVDMTPLTSEVTMAERTIESTFTAAATVAESTTHTVFAGTGAPGPTFEEMQRQSVVQPAMVVPTESIAVVSRGISGASSRNAPYAEVSPQMSLVLRNTMENALSSLVSTVEALISEIDNMKARKQVTHEEISSVMTSISRVESYVYRVETNLRSRTDEVENLVNANTYNLERSLNAAIDSHAASMNAEVEKLRITIDHLRREVSGYGYTLNEAQSSMDKHRGHMGDLDRRVAHIEQRPTRNEESFQQHQTLSATVDQHQTAITGLGNQVNSIMTSVSHLDELHRAHLDALEQQRVAVAALEQQHRVHVGSFETLEQHHRAHAEALHQHQAVVAALEQGHGSVADSVRGLEQRYVTCVEGLEQHRSIITALQQVQSEQASRLTALETAGTTVSGIDIRQELESISKNMDAQGDLLRQLEKTVGSQTTRLNAMDQTLRSHTSPLTPPTVDPTPTARAARLPVTPVSGTTGFLTADRIVINSHSPTNIYLRADRTEITPTNTTAYQTSGFGTPILADTPAAVATTTVVTGASGMSYSPTLVDAKPNTVVKSYGASPLVQPQGPTTLVARGGTTSTVQQQSTVAKSSVVSGAYSTQHLETTAESSETKQLTTSGVEGSPLARYHQSQESSSLKKIAEYHQSSGTVERH